MKETGIVRRIDELGRVVIPKEIRRTLRLKESDPLEIFTERDMLCFKKYSPVTAVGDFAESLCAALSETTQRLCIITDTDCVLAARGAKGKEYVGKNLIKEMCDVLTSRRAVTFDGDTNGEVKRIVEGGEKQFENILVVPTVTAGDLIGSVMLCGGEAMRPDEIRMTEMCADILARQF